MTRNELSKFELELIPCDKKGYHVISYLIFIRFTDSRTIIYYEKTGEDLVLVVLRATL